jgi:hypothetical protein
MSQENVAIVRGIYLASDGDYVPLFRDEETWAVTKAANEPFFSTDFECTMPLFDSHRIYTATRRPASCMARLDGAVDHPIGSRSRRSLISGSESFC